MDSGDVESSGAVEYSGGPVKDETSEKTIEEVHFHAGAIEKPDESTYFNSPKDQKRRAKEKRKHIKAEVKRILKDVKAKKHDEAIEAKKARKGKGFWARLFKGWHKYLIIGVVVVLVVVGNSLLFRFYIKPLQEERKEEEAKAQEREDLSASSYAQRLYEEMADDMRYYGKENVEAYNKAKNRFEKEIEQGSREKKIYITLIYADFVYRYTGDISESERIITSAEQYAKTDDEKDDIRRRKEEYKERRKLEGSGE